LPPVRNRNRSDSRDQLLNAKNGRVPRVILGTFIAMIAFAILAIHPTVATAYATLVVIALGELTQQPRYYDYISRLAPSGQQAPTWAFAFLLSYRAFLAGRIGGTLLHYFGEVRHQPQSSGGFKLSPFTTLLLWLYDRIVKQARPPHLDKEFFFCRVQLVREGFAEN